MPLLFADAADCVFQRTLFLFVGIAATTSACRLDRPLYLCIACLAAACHMSWQAALRTWNLAFAEVALPTIVSRLSTAIARVWWCGAPSVPNSGKEVDQHLSGCVVLVALVALEPSLRRHHALISCVVSVKYVVGRQELVRRHLVPQSSSRNKAPCLLSPPPEVPVPGRFTAINGCNVRRRPQETTNNGVSRLTLIMRQKEDANCYAPYRWLKA